MAKLYGTPGPRVLGPDCCTSEKLAKCSLGAQLLFDRLLVQSDDQGRQHGDAGAVKGACMPLVREATTRAVSRWLAELTEAGLIRRYSVRDLEVIQVEQWWRFQSGQRRAYASRWPAPEGWEDRVYERRESAGNLPASDGESRAKRAHSAGKNPPLPLPMPLPVPDKDSLSDPAGPDGALGVQAESGHGPSKRAPFEPKHPRTRELCRAIDNCRRHWRPDVALKATSTESLRAMDGLLRNDRRDPERVIDLLEWVFSGEGGDYKPRGTFDWRRALKTAAALRRNWDALVDEQEAAQRALKVGGR